MDFRATLKILFIFGLLLVSISFNDPTWTVVSVIATLLVGLSLSLKLEELFILSIPFSFDVFVPNTINLNSSDFIVLPLLFIYAARYIKDSNQSHLLIKFSLWWFVCFTFALSVPFIFQLTPSGLRIENISSFLKLTIGFCYFLTAVLVFKYSSFALRSQLARLWCFVALLVSGISILGFLLSLGGLITQFMYVSTRVKGTFENPNTLALYLLVSLGVLIGVWINKPLLRYLAGASTITVALSLANSRAGTIAFIVLLFVILCLSFFGRSNWQIKKSLTLLVFPAIFFSVVPLGLFFWRILTINVPQSQRNSSTPETTSGTQEISSSDVATPVASSVPTSVPIENLTINRESIDGDLRFTLWDAALRLWKTNPITGVGFGNYPELSEKYTGVNYVTHNSFLSFLAETGIVGLSIFCIPFVSAIILLFINRKSFLAKSMIGVVFAVMVMMSANNFENIRFIWFVMGATLAWAFEKKLSLIGKTRFVWKTK